MPVSTVSLLTRGTFSSAAIYAASSKPYCSGLRSEQFVIQRLAFKKELPREEIADVLPAHDNGRRHVPHVVLALVKTELSGRHARGELCVTLDAVLAGSRDGRDGT